jgi:MFS family permease
MFSPLLSVLMPIPSLAWVPLFVLWLGIGNSSTILVVIYASVFTLTYNTWTGARAINQIWTKSAFVMGANSRQLLWHVMLPGTMPYVISGLRIAFGRAWIAVIGGELLVITYCFSLALSYPLGWMADRFHPLRIGLTALGLYAITMIWGGFVATEAKAFSIVFVAHGVLTGTYFTATASLGQRLFPRTKFAQFASAAGILAAMGLMVVPPALGWFLDSIGQVYRYTFLIGGVLAVVAAAAFVIVLFKFRQLGGDGAYRPPGDAI